MSQRQEPAVLVVGAGPTGLTLAVALRRYGVPLRIVDKAEQPTTQSKALAIWSASMEGLSGLGVMPELLAAGTRLHALRVSHGRRPPATLAAGVGIDSAYPFPLLVPQARTEAVLIGRLADLGVAVERGVELVGLERDADAATGFLRHPDGSVEELRVPYLVGCDGARSRVRQALDIPFEGVTEPGVMVLGDIRLTGGDLDRHGIYLSWTRAGLLALFPFGDDRWRLFARRDPDRGEAPPSLEELQAYVDRRGPAALRLEDPTWLAAFKVNERLAARYRLGRCLLAGDAAHIHSPVGGQGMNTGIQDAINLGWKLGQVLSGLGDPAVLLDSYEAERRPTAARVVAKAGGRHRMLMKSGWPALLARDLAARLAGQVPAVQRRIQVEFSATEVVYREGPLVRLGAPPRRAGHGDVGGRALDTVFVDPATGEEQGLWGRLGRPCHTLLLFEDAGRSVVPAALLEPLAGRLAVLRLDARSDPRGRARARYRLDGPGWVLVRPDLVVAARGGPSELGRLEGYLAAVLQPSDPEAAGRAAA
ncbi:2-polyprenyl-6-methoxyphenol hydroxylase [Tistlia consotensis]|uniref:2-polyprenyl-6-methoxyphenol hydroxylase n=1 Tax=Tistlia consotensis USBA 355 TaxID=560819 RepID=A0A1Y6C7I4_9PROT|nr:FAD-dependent monooxygenase [Tistlia consotensis]SMF38559.1 2-polyprenyl-6-methoxyphenol hydroxylase [Tistlia consotensis USBA 355]SNR37072.1 2-polyprenyl-6-methoxyphenol hydroxylase [Tistlia consotensis]